MRDFNLTRLLLILILPPTLIFAAALSAIRIGFYNNDVIENLLEPESCAMPCFMGIRPGETTLDEVADILLNHPWIDRLDVYQWSAEDLILDQYEEDAQAIPAWDSRYSSIQLTWFWSDSAPSLYAADAPPPTLRLRDSVVESVSFRSSARYADFFLAMGDDPQRTAFDCQGGSVDSKWMLAGLYTEYPDQGVQFTVRVPATYCPTVDATCAIGRRDFWVTDTRVNFGAPPLEGLDIDYDVLISHVGCDFYRLETGGER